MAMRILLGFYIFILGLCFGSFALATAWRIKNKRSFSGTERSVCEKCGHTLKAIDLIPLFSWLTLKGKCRYCHKRLSSLLPLSELLGGVLFAGSYLFWPENLQGLFGIASLVIWLVGLALLLILFLYDIQWYILPNKVIYPLWAVSGLYFLFHFLQDPSLQKVVLGIGALLVGAGFFWILYEVSKGKWIGFGDVRLGVAIGLFVGTPVLAALVIFTASLLGVVVALPGLVTKSRKLNSKLPFGPLLIIALVLVQLFGQKLVDWYSTQFLYL